MASCWRLREAEKAERRKREAGTQPCDRDALHEAHGGENKKLEAVVIF